MTARVREVCELAFRTARTYPNPFADATLDVEFTAPPPAAPRDSDWALVLRSVHDD